MFRRKGQRIELKEGRARPRRGITSIEQKRWFAPVLMSFCFWGFGGAMFWLASGLRFPCTFADFKSAVTVRPVAAGLISGITALFLCGMVLRLRRTEFELMRARGRHISSEQELERFILMLLKEMRLPLKQIRESSGKALKDLQSIQGEIDKNNLPGPIKEKLSAFGSQDSPVVKEIKTAAEGAGRLDVLPAGLLKIARLRKAEPRLEWLEMNSLVIRIAEQLRDLVDRSGAKLEMKDLPSCLGDRKMVETALYELIRNAIENRRDGQRPVVRIWGETHGRSAVYCVEDNGRGIEEKNFEKIFDMFYKPATKQDGQGLGLSVVRRVVRQHNGRIWLKSTPGEGSVFTIALPGG